MSDSEFEPFVLEDTPPTRAIPTEPKGFVNVKPDGPCYVCRAFRANQALKTRSGNYIYVCSNCQMLIKKLPVIESTASERADQP